MAKSRSRKRKSPLSRLKPSRGLVSVLLSILTLVLLGVALVVESFLLGAVSALSALATVLQVRLSQQRAEAEAKKAAARPPKRPPRTRAATPRKPDETPATPGASSGPVMCTETGKVVDDCPCASRHVASPEGARRYGLPVGSPLGRRSKAGKVAGTVQRS